MEKLLKILSDINSGIKYYYEKSNNDIFNENSTIETIHKPKENEAIKIQIDQFNIWIIRILRKKQYTNL